MRGLISSVGVWCFVSDLASEFDLFGFWHIVCEVLSLKFGICAICELIEFGI